MRDVQFEVPVIINTGGQNLGAIDLEIRYSTAYLEVPTTSSGPMISEGSGWTKGIFQAVVDPPGVIRLGGAVDPDETVSGTEVELARITFRGVAATPTRNPAQIVGTVITFAQNDLQGSAIGDATPRDSVAGQVQVFVTVSARRRRSATAASGGSGAGGVDGPIRLRPFGAAAGSGVVDVHGVALPYSADTVRAFEESLPAPSKAVLARRARAAERARREAVETCDSPPCSECVNRFNGDANGDCEFDIRDVSYTQLFLAERSFDFSRQPQGVELLAQLIPAQLMAMDADLNDEINLADAKYMALVNFNLQRFVEVDVVPVQNQFSRGRLTVNVTVKAKPGNDVGTESAAVFVLLSHPDASLQSNLSANVYTHGTPVAAYSPSAASASALVRAERYPPLYVDYQQEDQPLLCLLPRASGSANCNLGAPVTRYRYDRTLGECVTFSYYGCQGNDNNFETAHDCESTCVPTFRYAVSADVDFVAADVGVSILLITFDSQGDTATGRDIFLSGSASNGTFAYAERLEFDVTVSPEGASSPQSTVGVLATNGFNALASFANRLRSSEAINDFSPRISPAPSLSILESMATMDSITQIVATDQDPGQTSAVTLGLQGGVLNPASGLLEAGRVGLEASTGRVHLLQQVDYENEAQRAFNFTVVAVDNSPPWPRETLKEYAVSVIDVNDNAPVFAPAVYGARISVDAPAGTTILRVTATDADSNTAAGGQNKALTYSMRDVGSGGASSGFSISQEGVIFTSGTQARSLSETVELVVTATDGGVPARSAEARVYVAVINDDYLVTITTRPGLEEFNAQFDNETNSHPCLDTLGEILGGQLVVLEVLANSERPLDQTDVTFYVVNGTSQEVLPTDRVNALLSTVEDFEACSLRDVDTQDRSFESSVRFAGDEACESNIGLPPANAARQFHKTCLADAVANSSARIECFRENPDDPTSPVMAEVRVYDTANCRNLGDYAPAVLTTNNDTCVEAVLNNASLYLQARCYDLLDVPTNSKSSSTEPLLIAGFTAGSLLVFIVILVLLLRYQRQRKQLDNARKMVLAHHGDVLFGTPEPMRKEPERTVFTGGEIDPETGEVTRFKETTTVVDDQATGGSRVGVAATSKQSLDEWDTRLPSMFGGLRNNPLYGTSNFPIKGRNAAAYQFGRSGGLGGRGGGANAGTNVDADDDDDDDDGLSDATSLASVGSGDGDGDSLLGDMSDFEMFEQEMFGAHDGDKGHHRNPPMFAADFGDDELSDFDELDDDEGDAAELNAGYLDMDSSSEDVDDDDDDGADFDTISGIDDDADLDDMFEDEQPAPSRGILKTGASAGQHGRPRVSFGNVVAHGADEEDAMSTVSMRRNVNTRRRREVTSMDIESELVMPQVQFEDVATSWQTRQDSIPEETADDDDDDDDDDVNIQIGGDNHSTQETDSYVAGSHMQNLKSIWTKRGL